jgi:hypothetical protein
MTWSERTRIELDDRVEATTRALRAAAVEAEMAISGDSAKSAPTATKPDEAS